MAQITVDGQPLEFKAGDSIIAVATRQNIEIPYYCWHPRLSVAANCRMCLVEVEKAPKLVPACQTECKDGMVVHTRNAKVKDAQRAVHEFLLVNHPIDCPICDQAGECKLQDYYMKFQLTASRMRDEKVHKRKLLRLGPHVMYNAERCIVCTRCVRFMEEVPKQRQLGVFNRGDHSIIGTYPGQELNNPYSLNTVDVCPVGALTSTVFRFKQRVWNLRRSASVCPGCARGCNVQVDQRSGQVYRLLPRENEAVNQSWLCDEGRLTYNRPNEGRLDQSLCRVGKALPEPSAIDESWQRAITLLKPVAASSQVTVAISAHATNEEAYVMGRLAKDVLGQDSVYVLAYADGEADALLRVADKNPNRQGVTRVLQDLGIRPLAQNELLKKLRAAAVKALLCVGHEAADSVELATELAKLEVMVHVAHARSPLSDVAHVTLPGTCWVQVDGTWVNSQGRVQRLAPAYAPHGAAKAHHVWMLQLAQALGGTWQYPSMHSIQSEMQSQLATFREVPLTQIPTTGWAAA